MSDVPTEAEILEALDRSGYLMEQEVATRFEKLGYNVQTNYAYQDQDEGKSRELDVRAVKRVAVNKVRRISAYVELLIECKQNANPFVFVGRSKNAADRDFYPKEYVFPYQYYEATKRIDATRSKVRELNPFYHLGLDKAHPWFGDHEKAVQFCRIDREKSKWGANHGGVFEATVYPMAKVLSVRRTEIGRPRSAEDWRYLWLLVPTVILSSDIYYASTAHSSRSLEKRPFVHFRRSLKSKSLEGQFPIDFVKKAEIEQFHHQCLQPVSDLMLDLVETRSEFLLDKDVPWIDP